ncbi:MAG: hypothetical protein QXE84_01610 [Candidatus Nitrosotenuis sp.]|uniref:Uncharacterized protein n=1 Tax=Candidatus Nitrosotenuis uzonensis TaxID=1407055 RepID=A0A812F361_9ARCH|nr:hypothetical protein [Candidatus Nitrosotenuis uzonensis]MCA2003826.1 hypothetical protein [Candidatus Nitrosotenuis sp.]CAE6484194.1 conserved hypothetical protein [Candidatus Nitrosotenuis uzonensis]
MAMPMDYDSMREDESSERASSVDDYKVTCIRFIEDISKDYLAWVDYYKLPPDEDKKRRDRIASVIVRTNEWIAKVAQTIKGIDVVMNDGIQKMAESTAGQPFQIGVFVNKQSGYTMSKPGLIDVNIKAVGREGRKTKIIEHYKGQQFRLESTAKVFIDETHIPQQEFDMMDVHLILDATAAQQRDLISFTISVAEMENGYEFDKRGVSTIIHIV